MDCRFVERSLSEYLSGELSAQLALELEQHVQACPACKTIYTDFQQMITACQALPSLEARDEVWRLLKDRLPAAPEFRPSPRGPVQDTISQLRQSLAFYRRLAYGALSFAALSLFAWGGQYFYQRQLNAAINSAPAPIEAVEIQKAEVHYQIAIKSLTQALERTQKEWDPGTRIIVERNLKTIDASIAECEAALSREPNDVEAGTYLLAAYRKKVDFLKSVLEPSAI
jgi:tetratricopeptide (TPR) repeat protein